MNTEDHNASRELQHLLDSAAIIELDTFNDLLFNLDLFNHCAAVAPQGFSVQLASL